jgi:hypothetical protein
MLELLVVGYSWNDHQLTFVNIFFRSGSTKKTAVDGTKKVPSPKKHHHGAGSRKLRDPFRKTRSSESSFLAVRSGWVVTFLLFSLRKMARFGRFTSNPIGSILPMQVPGTFLPWICVWCRWYMSTCPTQTGDSQIQRSSSSPGVGAPLWLGAVSVGNVNACLGDKDFYVLGWSEPACLSRSDAVQKVQHRKCTSAQDPAEKP